MSRSVRRLVQDACTGGAASDCKALLTAQMMALAILMRNGVRLRHGVRLVSGADEEHGGALGVWLVGGRTSRGA